MATKFTEKRKHVRVYFPPGQEPVATFAWLENPDEIVEGSVMDLSQGGLHIAFKNEKEPINMGEKIILYQIALPDEERIEKQCQVVVRWSCSHPKFNRSYIGCQFIDLPEWYKNRIKDLLL